jgi:SiaC family regulatory phosphoprotein
MEALLIAPTDHTPGVEFNAQTGKLKLTGRSLPENAIEFYDPLFDWLDNYIAIAPNQTELHVDLDYLNSISQKMIVEILKNTKKVESSGKVISVNWYYDEEDEKMMEEGKAIASEFELPIILFPKPSVDE